MEGLEERDGVNHVSDTTKGQGKLDTDLVDDGTTKETEDGEGGVESSVLDI